MIRCSKQPVADFGLTFSSCLFHFDENTDNIAYNYTDNMACNYILKTRIISTAKMNHIGHEGAYRLNWNNNSKKYANPYN